MNQKAFCVRRCGCKRSCNTHKPWYFTKHLFVFFKKNTRYFLWIMWITPCISPFFQLFTLRKQWISFFEFRTLFFFFPIDFFSFVQGTQFGLFCTSLLHEEQEGDHQNNSNRYGQPGQDFTHYQIDHDQNQCNDTSPRKSLIGIRCRKSIHKIGNALLLKAHIKQPPNTADDQYCDRNDQVIQFSSAFFSNCFILPKSKFKIHSTMTNTSVKIE